MDTLQTKLALIKAKHACWNKRRKRPKVDCSGECSASSGDGCHGDGECGGDGE
jgi:hypothetical protein